VGRGKKIATHKKNLMTYLVNHEIGKNYILESHTINAHAIMKNTRLLDKYKSLFTPDTVYIFKPVSGYAGANIEMFTSYSQLLKSMGAIIKKWSPAWNKGSSMYKEWVLQEYLADPLLYRNPVDNNEYKFHIRHYYIFRPGNKKSFFLKKALFTTALKPYKQGDWSNKDIHDTHFHGRDGLHFPKDMTLTPYQKTKINKQIYELYSIIDEALKKNTGCFDESKYCFEVFGADLMITKDYKVKILEMNSSPGLAYDDREEVQEEKKSVIENYMSVIVDDYFPPANPVENKFAKDVVFLN
jgi:tubulin polyglutamylase TTLL9